MYDFAHPLSDAIEGITHSICTLEFENNRAVYDWLVDNLFPEPRPRQYEFARLNLDYTVMSKRKLLQLVEEGLVCGWDDPRLPTIAGMRRRGYAPEGIRLFAAAHRRRQGEQPRQHGAARGRDPGRPERPRAAGDGGPAAPQATITNWPGDRVEELVIPLWPKDAGKEGTRAVPLTRDIFIDRTDFSVDPPPTGGDCAGRRGAPHGGYFIRCDEVVRDPHRRGGGAALLVRPESLGASAKGDRKKTTAIQWSPRCTPVPAEVRLYDRLFTVADPEDVEEGRTFKEFLSPASSRCCADASSSPPSRPPPPGPVPVRPQRLLHCRRGRLEARRPRLQPHRRPQGQVPAAAAGNRGKGQPMKESTAFR